MLVRLPLPVTLMLGCVLLWLSSAKESARADHALVVCPTRFRPALSPWVKLRRSQGHSLRFVDSVHSVTELRHIIRQGVAEDNSECVLLIGDVNADASARIPTYYSTAEVNVRWGSSAQLATDTVYADLNRDERPDIAIGRIPVKTPAELAVIVSKIVRHEEARQVRGEPATLEVLAGAGGFSPVVDHVIEMAARQILSTSVPADVEVRLTRASSITGASEAQPAIYRQLSSSGLAWIYMGHGFEYGLATASHSQRAQWLLSTTDLARRPLSAGKPGPPLALLLACYTGAFDAPHDCLAETLLKQPGGPACVIAATRVTMPYGNAVMGHELLEACFTERAETVGELLLAAQRATLADSQPESLRATLDQLAGGLMPPPANLAGERREHVQMYCLLGDPLLRLPAGQPVRIAREPDATPKLGAGGGPVVRP